MNIILRSLMVVLGNIALASPPVTEPQEMRVTCYTSPATAHTADGSLVRYGLCASSRANLGRTIAVYDQEYELVGYFRCADTGSAQSLRNGTSIDIYQPSLEECYEWIAEYGDYMYISFFE